MKKLVLKGWVENVVSVAWCVAFILIATTIETEWSVQYFEFVGINLLVMIGCTCLLVKYGRK